MKNKFMLILLSTVLALPALGQNTKSSKSTAKIVKKEAKAEKKETKADKKETPGWLYPILALVFIAVGFIEVFSIAIRPFTLSVRLFGNVFGGENLLEGTGFFFVFYFMELLVGLIQALVFTLLTSVYIGLLCNHGDDHAHDDDHGPTAEAHH